MATLMDVAKHIAKSRRLKKALFDEESTPLDLESIFVDFGLSIFEATKKACTETYGQWRHLDSTTEIKKFIKDTSFPKIVEIDLR